jgi:hypothetical protein
MIDDALLTREQVRERLSQIFPQGTAFRANITNPTAASTVFTALYIDAVEGSDQWLGPKHVYRMTEEQAAQTDAAARATYVSVIRNPKGVVNGARWYADNTREGIRDDTLREGLVAIGAVIELAGVPTTSSKPRYALTADFADLFNPDLQGEALAEAISTWRAKALNAGALARLAINRQGAGKLGDKVLVTFPNGETRLMKPGPSSELTRAVVEVFAKRFLIEPAVLFISESGKKIVARDEQLAAALGLHIQADKDLPDIILADTGTPHTIIAFVEVVASDGPISERRKAALQALVAKSGFPSEHVAFVTAYLDRSAAPFKKTVSTIAWGSYGWFAAEPERLMIFSDGDIQLSGTL